MAQLAFDLTYDGPRVEHGGAIPVRSVTPALDALDELVRVASLAAFPSREPATLTLRGTEEGSLVLQLLLEAGWDHLVDVFSSDSATALVNLFELVLGGYGLFELISKLRGRRIVEEGPTGPAGTVDVVLEDGERITVDADVLALHRNAVVRKRARTVVQPLELDGVDRLTIVRDSEITVSLGTDDVPSFDPPPLVEEPLADLVEEGIVVSIAAPSFKENKWRFDYGGSTFAAAMDDPVYRQDVESGREAFRAGDMLRVDMRVIQSRSDDGLHTERRVMRVIDYIPRGVQLRLSEPAADGDDDAHAA
ncbi:MAG: hypothetical protein JWQ20_3449 [Conexibacter sp.]|nr:hypothetical protein [Conexibacter sp.]